MELLAFVITPVAVLALSGLVAWIAGRPPPALRYGVATRRSPGRIS
jgi:hypothetical protein